MSHFGKFTVSAALIAPLLLGGCRPTKGTASPQDYFPLIQVAMAGGETGAMIGRNEAIKAKSFAGCVASEALITAFDSANTVLAGRMADKIIIPAVEIDVSECLALRKVEAADEPEAEEDGGDNASTPVHLGTAVAAYAAPAEEAPAEEAPAEEPAAEEPAAEEPAAEEPAAEEPIAEEPVEEDEAAKDEPKPVEMTLEGDNSEAALLVEAVAGITMVAVLYYAVKLKSVNCKKGTAALGVINYVNGMITPIADEIANPDGKISVPAVAIDLSECSDS